MEYSGAQQNSRLERIAFWTWRTRRKCTRTSSCGISAWIESSRYRTPCSKIHGRRGFHWVSVPDDLGMLIIYYIIRFGSRTLQRLTSSWVFDARYSEKNVMVATEMLTMRNCRILILFPMIISEWLNDMMMYGIAIISIEPREKPTIRSAVSMRWQHVSWHWIASCKAQKSDRVQGQREAFFFLLRKTHARLSTLICDRPRVRF